MALSELLSNQIVAGVVSSLIAAAIIKLLQKLVHKNNRHE